MGTAELEGMTNTIAEIALLTDAAEVTMMIGAEVEVWVDATMSMTAEIAQMTAVEAGVTMIMTAEEVEVVVTTATTVEMIVVEAMMIVVEAMMIVVEAMMIVEGAMMTVEEDTNFPLLSLHIQVTDTWLKSFCL